MTTNKQFNRGIATSALMVLVVAILVAGLGIYEAQKKVSGEPGPNGSSTLTTVVPTGWKTYQDAVWGFTLAHPATWQSTVSTESGRIVELSGGSEGQVRLYAVTIPMNQELEAYLSEKDRLNATGYEGQPSATIHSSNRISLDGLPAIEREESWNAAGFSRILVTYLKRGDKVIVLHQMPIADDGSVTSAERSLYRQIVRSLTFAVAKPVVTPATSTPVVSTGTKLRLHFQDLKGIAMDCEATMLVERTIAPTPRVASAALDILFTENLPKIRSAFNSITIANGVATLDFKPAALEYLNGPACEQASYKTPIEQTLKEFSTVKSVQYSIDGKLHTEWDA